MVYCTESDVYGETGFTTNIVQRLTEKSVANVTILINGFIADAEREINDAIAVPYTVHQEKHIVEEVPTEGDEGNVTRIYLGMYETAIILDTYAEPDRLMMDDFNVQDSVVKVLRVWVNCYRRAKNDEDYGWSHTPNKGYVDFIGEAGGGEDLKEGDTIHISYIYNPFLASVPNNIKTACACLAGVALTKHLLGVRESYQALEAEDLMPMSDKENLYAKIGSLKARAKENIASYGYGFHGTVAI